MSNEEAYRVSSFNTAYDIWEALRVAYEGDDSVKEQQIQAYMTKFENLRMFEYESFDEFYLRLATIVNQAAGIGHVFDNATIIKKIFRVLQELSMDLGLTP